MHLAEGMLPISQAVGWSAVTLPVLIWSMRGEQLERKAFVCGGASQINLPCRGG